MSFLHCTDCEDPGQRCLIDYSIVYCSFDDSTWSWMFTISLVDLGLICAPLLALLLVSLRSSWRWQERAVVGSELPWLVAFSEFYTQGYHGHSHKLRVDAAQALVARRKREMES